MMFLQAPPPTTTETLTSIIIQEEQPEPTPEPKLYTIVEGDNLTKIADAHTTSVDRLWDANPQLDHPDLIEPSEVLKIPETDEVLEDRPMPVVQPKLVQFSPSTKLATSTSGNTAGNTYAPRYCTWWAKQMRPDLPNMMGDARFWVSSARAHGFATGSTPRIGAIGQQGNHVVYIVAVNGNMVTTSEMNYKGLGIVSSRTVPASTFVYIY